jgi:hypothetical protein
MNMKSNVMPMNRIETIILSYLMDYKTPASFHDILIWVRSKQGSGVANYQVSAALTYLIRIRKVTIYQDGVSFIVED